MIENAAGTTRKQHDTIQNLHRAIGKRLIIASGMRIDFFICENRITITYFSCACHEI